MSKKSTEERRAEKKAKFENTDCKAGHCSSSKRTTMMGVAIALVVVAVAAFVIFGGAKSGYTAVSAQDGVVKLALDKVSDGKAHYYTYRGADGKEIKFFVLKSADGVVRAAFDACDVCFRAKLGYRQEGDEMVCNNCNQRFPSNKINEIKGGCNPGPLGREVKGNELVIAVAEIEQGAWYF